MSAGFAASFIIAFAPQPQQRDDASIVPYKSFAAFIIIGKVSLRRDEGIPPYRDKIPFGVYTKKAELLTALLLHFMGISYFMPCSCSFSRTAPTPR